MHNRNFLEERPPRRESKAGFALSPLSSTSGAELCMGSDRRRGFVFSHESNALNPSQPPAGPTAPELSCS